MTMMTQTNTREISNIMNENNVNYDLNENTSNLLNEE